MLVRLVYDVYVVEDVCNHKLQLKEPIFVELVYSMASWLTIMYLMLTIPQENIKIKGI